MDNLIIHTQLSLLAFCNKLSEDLTLKHTQEFTGVNIDAHRSEVDMPEGNIIGLEDFTYEERDDPVAVVAGQIIVGIDTDSNNELLIKCLAEVLKQSKDLKSIPLRHYETGEVIGSLLFQGYRTVPPVAKGTTKTFQGVIFEAGVLLEV